MEPQSAAYKVGALPAVLLSRPAAKAPTAPEAWVLLRATPTASYSSILERISFHPPPQDPHHSFPKLPAHLPASWRLQGTGSTQLSLGLCPMAMRTAGADLGLAEGGVC